MGVWYSPESHEEGDPSFPVGPPIKGLKVFAFSPVVKTNSLRAKEM